MAVKAELHPDVVWELRHVFTRAEVLDFYQQLARTRASPLRNSELHADRRVSRYVLRRFSFGRGVEKIAIFHYDQLRGVIRVLKCRPFEPRRLRNPSAGPPDSPA